MRSVRSVSAGGRDKAQDVAKEAFTAFARSFPVKLYWFLSMGYQPHEWQGMFHAATTSSTGLLCRFRHLVAGRRGGKTLCAAWEVVFYCLHPSEFHRDMRGETSDRPLWVNLLSKDHKVGFPSEQALKEVLAQCELVKDKDYTWNKTDKIVTFNNGSFIQIRSAEDPESLRGAGLDILWIDEAAAIPSRAAWDVIRPSIADKPGCLITTTTPKGKNWFYEEFFTKLALKDEWQSRVEYTSIDSPYFRKEIWDYEKRTMHPALFAQEYLAAFDAMSGLTLSGEWLKYYTAGEEGIDSIRLPRAKDGRIKLDKYIGVDPSTGESDDEFAISVIGITPERDQAFLLDYWTGKIQFPDQVDKIREWFLRYRPQMIGVESNAYQRSLAQQSARMEGMPGIVPVFSKGKKNERIVSMSPLFKIGKMRIHRTHIKFIDQWVSFDGTRTNNTDDLLDSVEIALGVAGVLLPDMLVDDAEKKLNSLEEEALEQIARQRDKNLTHDTLGSEV